MRVGTDICEVSRFADKVDDIKFLNRVFTKKERAHIETLNVKQARMERMAGKFCAKEAVLKLLGTGLDKGIKWLDIEILPDENGKPCVVFSGMALKIKENLKIKEIELSISHTATMAMAVCASN